MVFFILNFLNIIFQPRSHHETFTIWSPEMFAGDETRRLLRLRVEAELPEEEQQPGSVNQTRRNNNKVLICCLFYFR